jgi:carboxypeptidase Q
MKNSSFNLIFCIILAANAMCNAQEKPDTAINSQIKNAELRNSHIPEMGNFLTDVCGPRLTNSPGFYCAAS